MSGQLLQKDRLKFKDLANRILPRLGTGCLAFVTCDRGELQAEILAGLEAQFRGVFRLCQHAIRPHQPYLGSLPVYDPESPELHVFTDYPYDRLVADDPKLVEENRMLAETLNIERDLLTWHNLHMIWILPQHVENTIALVAPDFYHFRTYSVHFHADLLPVLPKPPKLDLTTMERGWFLEKQLQKSSNFIHKANTHMDLAKWNMSASETVVARKHLDAAVKLYQKQKFNQGLAAAYQSLGGLLMDELLFRQAEAFYRRALKLLDGRRDKALFVTYLNLASCLLTQCACDAAETTLRKVPLSELGDEELAFSYHHHQAYLCALRGETGRALSTLRSQRPVEIVTERTGTFALAITLFEQLGESDEKSCEYDHDFFANVKGIYTGEWSQVSRRLLEKQGEDWAPIKTMAFLLYLKREYASAAHVAIQALELLAKREIESANRQLKALLLRIERHTKPAAEVEAACLACLAQWQNVPAHECTLLRVVLGFIYCDSDRPALAWDMVHQATAVAEPANYRFILGEIAMLSAKLHGKEGQWPAAYDALKQGYEHVRDRHVALEAELLELMGQAAKQCGNPRARGWYQKALALYEMLELKQATVVAAALARLDAPAGAQANAQGGAEGDS